MRSGKPLLVVGERGTGRLSRLRRAAALLADDGWMTFEAGAAEINAGMTYVGELEGRISHLVRTLDGERVLWIAPAFEALLYAGVTRQNPQGGALDLLLAGMADARVHVAGILAPGAYERLIRARPELRDAFDVVRVGRWTSRARCRWRPPPRRTEPCAARGARARPPLPRRRGAARARCSRCWRRCAAAGQATS